MNSATWVQILDEAVYNSHTTEKDMNPTVLPPTTVREIVKENIKKGYDLPLSFSPCLPLTLSLSLYIYIYIYLLIFDYNHNYIFNEPLQILNCTLVYNNLFEQLYIDADVHSYFLFSNK